MLAAYYSVVKDIHIGSVCLSGGLFTLRAGWMLVDSPRLQRRWVKIVPHIVDTLLLASAIVLTTIIHQYPFVQSWLTAKVLWLVGYIVLASIGLKYGPNKRVRILACGAALAVYATIVTIALAYDPRGWLLWLSWN